MQVHVISKCTHWYSDILKKKKKTKQEIYDEDAAFEEKSGCYMVHVAFDQIMPAGMKEILLEESIHSSSKQHSATGFLIVYWLILRTKKSIWLFLASRLMFLTMRHRGSYLVDHE